MIFINLLVELFQALIPVVRDAGTREWRVSTESLAALVGAVFALLRTFGVELGLDPVEFAGVLSAVVGFVYSQRRKREGAEKV